MKIALIGYGKMGKAIESIAVDKGHEIVLKITSSNKEELTTENIQKADIAIEFTNPQSAVANIKLCLNAGVPVVCGSTGWLEYKTEIDTLVKERNGSFLQASNFSIGVNLFFKLNEYLTQLIAPYNYDVKMKEVHHTQKKDAPSGTAITIAECIINNQQTKQNWISRLDNESDTHAKEELLIVSERTDPAPGTHIVTWANDIDEIEIIHTAKNRIGFATGAVVAAEYIKDKKGIFTMRDVLSLN